MKLKTETVNDTLRSVALAITFPLLLLLWLIGWPIYIDTPILEESDEDLDFWLIDADAN